MLTKLSQQQLEVIRGKYLEQNKSLAQQNSTLLMKCNLLENKISQLLKENTQLKTDKFKFETRIDHELIGLETAINDQFKQFSQSIKNFNTGKTVSKPTKIETSKPQKVVVENSIPEEDEEEEREKLQPKMIDIEKVKANVPIVNDVEEVEDRLVEGKQPIPSENHELPAEENEIPDDKQQVPEDTAQDMSQMIELSVKADEEIVSSSTPIASPVKPESITVVEPTTEVINNDSSSSSDLITDRPRIKRRRKSEINYKLPSLKNKMRRNGDKKWVGAIYDKDDDNDDLITVDKRRDSFGNWLQKDNEVVDPVEKVEAEEVQPIQSDEKAKELKAIERGEKVEDAKHIQRTEKAKVVRPQFSETAKESKPIQQTKKAKELKPIQKDEKVKMMKTPVQKAEGEESIQDTGEKKPDQEIEEEVVELTSTDVVASELELIRNNASYAEKAKSPLTTRNVNSKANSQVKETALKNARPTTRRDSIHPRITKKTPLGDITNTQNIKSNSNNDGNSKLKLKSNVADLSVFDFIDEDNVERRTIFNKRRNSII